MAPRVSSKRRKTKHRSQEAAPPRPRQAPSAAQEPKQELSESDISDDYAFLSDSDNSLDGFIVEDDDNAAASAKRMLRELTGYDPSQFRDMDS
jgi:hypothetical protein